MQRKKHFLKYFLLTIQCKTIRHRQVICMKHQDNGILLDQRRIQNSIKHLRWNVLQKLLTTKSC